MSNDPFQKIAEDAIDEAERVPCSFEVFKRGLVTIWQEINQRVENESINPRDPAMLEEDDT